MRIKSIGEIFLEFFEEKIRLWFSDVEMSHYSENSGRIFGDKDEKFDLVFEHEIVELLRIKFDLLSVNREVDHVDLNIGGVYLDVVEGS